MNNKKSSLPQRQGSFQTFIKTKKFLKEDEQLLLAKYNSQIKRRRNNRVEIPQNDVLSYALAHDVLSQSGDSANSAKEEYKQQPKISNEEQGSLKSDTLTSNCGEIEIEGLERILYSKDIKTPDSIVGPNVLPEFSLMQNNRSGSQGQMNVGRFDDQDHDQLDKNAADLTGGQESSSISKDSSENPNNGEQMKQLIWDLKESMKQIKSEQLKQEINKAIESLQFVQYINSQLIIVFQHGVLILQTMLVANQIYGKKLWDRQTILNATALILNLVLQNIPNFKKRKIVVQFGMLSLGTIFQAVDVNRDNQILYLNEKVIEYLLTILYICFGIIYDGSLFKFAIILTLQFFWFQTLAIDSQSSLAFLVQHLINSLLSGLIQCYSTKITDQCIILGKNVLQCASKFQKPIDPQKFELISIPKENENFPPEQSSNLGFNTNRRQLKESERTPNSISMRNIENIQQPWTDSRTNMRANANNNENKELLEALQTLEQQYCFEIQSNNTGNQMEQIQQNTQNKNMSLMSLSNNSIKNNNFDDFIFGAIGKSVILCTISEEKKKYSRTRNFSIVEENPQIQINRSGNINRKSSKFLTNNLMKIENRAIKLHIQRFSKQFFKELPNYNYMIRKINQYENDGKNEKNWFKTSKTLLNGKKQDSSDSVEKDDESKMRDKYLQAETSQFKEKYLFILEEKIYSPFFISKQTIIQYQNEENEMNLKLSFMDIVNTLHRNQRTINNKLYFKVDINEMKKQESSDMLHDEGAYQISKQQSVVSSFFNNGGNSKIKQENEPAYKYYEIEMKNTQNDGISSGVQVIKQDQGKNAVIIIFRDISNIINNQQRLSDQMYQDAIEKNYSHEQMNPLNCINQSSKLVSKSFQMLLSQIGKKHTKQQQRQFDKQNKQTYFCIEAIRNSGKLMWYYNQNQIQRMKIKKNEFVEEIGEWKQPVEYIKKVVYPFNLDINRFKIQVFIARNDSLDFDFKMDWGKYQLILYNIIQNAVKYNREKGIIIIELNCLPQQFDVGDHTLSQKRGRYKKLGSSDDNKDDQFYVLETNVIDSGIGISQERQKMLFTPFLELKIKQNLNKVKDHTIGMGLACSNEICKKLGGDPMNLQSEKNFTLFSFKLPVLTKKVSENAKEPDVKDLESLIKENQNESLQKILQYVEEKEYCSFVNLPFDDKFLHMQFEKKVNPQKNQILQNQMISQQPRINQSNNESNLVFDQNSVAVQSSKMNFRNKVKKGTRKNTYFDVNQHSQPLKQPSPVEINDGNEELEELKFNDLDKSIDSLSSYRASIDDRRVREMIDNHQKKACEKKEQIVNRRGKINDKNIKDSSIGDLRYLIDKNENSVSENYIQEIINFSQSSYIELDVNKVSESNSILSCNNQPDQSQHEEAEDRSQSEVRAAAGEDRVADLQESLVDQSSEEDHDDEIVDEVNSLSRNQNGEISNVGVIESSGSRHQFMSNQSLDLMDQIQDGQIQLPPESPICGCKPKILVVDDMEFNIIPVRYLLKQNYNIDIEDASDGKVALDKFTKELKKPCGCINRAYRLIFMDIGMPVMDGIEASNKITNLIKKKREEQKKEEYKNESDKFQDSNLQSGPERELCTIVALTAFTSLETQHKCKAAGIKEIIQKPLNSEVLASIMKKYFLF